MFTAEQIIAAHSKVTSGADFPSYIKVIRTLGVTQYETYVTDGHIDYHGQGGYTVTVAAKYDLLPIAENPQTEQFKTALSAHQKGQTDFLTFIKTCAKMGIAKWAVCMKKMTCTYFDKTGKEILVESIPG